MSMLSRVADALYWMARYSERTENNAHILNVQLLKMLEQSGTEYEYLDDWESVLDICASKEEYHEKYGTIRVNLLIDYLLFSEQNSNALLKTLVAVRENARITRDMIPIELWEVQNAFYLYLKNDITERAKPFPLISLNYFLQSVSKTSMTATGLIESSMDRDLPYHFMQIGKWLERMEKTIRMMLITIEHIKLSNLTYEAADGTFLLNLTRATETYFKKHHSADLKSVLSFLIVDVRCPRSISFCLNNTKQALIAIENAHFTSEFSIVFSQLQSLNTMIHKLDINALSVEETYLAIEKMLTLCIDFSHSFSTIYHFHEAVSPN
ncbi:MAG: alpha-E domain-containing protein [Lysinibacillus sp.]